MDIIALKLTMQLRRLVIPDSVLFVYTPKTPFSHDESNNLFHL